MKMDMNAVADEHRKRNDRLIQNSAHILAGAQNFEDDLYCEALALALLELAEMWREDARKAMEENKRGCKSTADSLRDCATRVAGVAIALRQHGLPQTSPDPKDDALVMPLSGEFSTVQAAAPLATSDLAAQFLTDIGNGKATKLYEATLNTVGRDVLAETGTITEAAQEIIAQVTEQRAAEKIDPHQVKVIKAAQLEITTTPLGFTMLTIAKDLTNGGGPIVTREGTMLEFTIGAPDPVPAWALQPQVPVMELTDDPATWQALPAYASVSQVQLMGDCGLKYWLRYRRGAPERPSWAMVGGSTLHACIATIEGIATPPSGSPGAAVWQSATAHREVGALWKDHFQNQIQRMQTENPLYPIETWHASNRGKEDRAWWETDGPEMVHRYLEWRAKWVAEGWELIRTQDGPLIEQEFLSFIGGAPVKGFIDQAWYHPQRQQVAIIDAKSGSSAPADYFQLAVYAMAARHRLGFYNAYVQADYVGGYWDARKGEIMASGLVNLDERHPQAELEHRFATLARMNQAAIYMPNTNSAYGGCNSCSLKRSCPIGSRMNAGAVVG